MKSNFRIKTQKHDQNLYIELSGVFDGASAFELTHAIAQAQEHNNFVFIDTDQLTQTFAFGKAILDFSLPKNTKRARFHFSGFRAEEIMPRGCTLFNKIKSDFHECSGNCKNCTCHHSKKVFQKSNRSQEALKSGGDSWRTN